MTADIYTQRHNVPFFFTNKNSEMSLSSMLNFVLLVSENQLNSLHLDGESMVEKGLGWVVTQYHIDITRMPKVNEEIDISTQAKSYNKFFCYRDFWIKDLEGNELVKINSIFVLIDIKKRSMVKITPEIVQPLGSIALTGMEKFPRIKKTDFEDNKRDIHIGYYNIDINQHVNNSYYFDWALDNLDIDFLNEHSIKTVDIKYENELVYGDNPRSFVKIDEKELLTYHRIETEEKKNAELIIKWK
ncbi:acyl-[acyl-carrier-protein] thioesterase [Companilactobacillus sp. DQM5]|uniref:acyl-[acyl-carrier-protein] thioesterase n=1 Tax=Companilactobacillus sp. DQM5 TaxID=3463359 RepID=UPI00405A469B